MAPGERSVALLRRYFVLFAAGSELDPVVDLLDRERETDAFQMHLVSRGVDTLMPAAFRAPVNAFHAHLILIYQQILLKRWKRAVIVQFAAPVEDGGRAGEDFDDQFRVMLDIFASPVSRIAGHYDVGVVIGPCRRCTDTGWSSLPRHQGTPWARSTISSAVACS